MLSTPPATITSPYPAWICHTAFRMACKPDEHCLWTVYAGTSSGKPPSRAATLAMLGASVLCFACPTMISSTMDFSMPDLLTAFSRTVLANSTARMSLKTPPMLPTGVLTADVMTTDFIVVPSYSVLFTPRGNQTTALTGCSAECCEDQVELLQRRLVV